jgi:hypothetical protein
MAHLFLLAGGDSDAARSGGPASMSTAFRDVVTYPDRRAGEVKAFEAALAASKAAHPSSYRPRLTLVS